MTWSFYSKDGTLIYGVVSTSVGDADTLDGIDSTGFVQIGLPGLNTGNVSLAGSLTLPVIANLTSDTTLTDADRTVLVNTQAPDALITITLPATPLTGQIYEIKDKGAGGLGYSSTRNIVVDGNGQNISGNPTYTINEDGKSIVIIYSGFAWHIINTASINTNASLLDGLDSSQFLRSDANDSASGSITFSETTQFNKSLYEPVSSVSTNTVIDNTYKTVLVDTTSSPITVTLPATPAVGQLYEIRDFGNSGSGNASVNNITIDRNSKLINGLTSDLTIDTDGDAVTIIFEGNGWLTLGQRFNLVALATSLDDLSDVNVSSPLSGEVFRYKIPANEWVNEPTVTIDDLGRLHLNSDSSTSGLSMGDDAGSGDEVTFVWYAARTSKISGRTIQDGVSNSVLTVLENGVNPISDTYDLVLPDDNTLVCNTSSGDLFIRVPGPLNTVISSFSGDRIVVKDVEGYANTNTLAVVAEGVRSRNVPLLSLDSVTGTISNASTTVTPGEPGVDEVQNFMVTGSGTYNIDFDGAITSGLTEASTASAVESALNNLSPHPNYGYFSVSVTGTDASSSLTVTFDGGTLIDGQAYHYLVVPYSSATLIYHNGNWFIV